MQSVIKDLYCNSDQRQAIKQLEIANLTFSKAYAATTSSQDQASLILLAQGLTKDALNSLDSRWSTARSSKHTRKTSGEVVIRALYQWCAMCLIPHMNSYIYLYGAACVAMTPKLANEGREKGARSELGETWQHRRSLSRLSQRMENGRGVLRMTSRAALRMRRSPSSKAQGSSCVSRAI